MESCYVARGRYRWSYRAVSWCWGRWLASHCQSSEYDARLRRLVCHFKHTSLSAALRGWQHGVKWYKRQQVLLARAGRRIRGLVIGRAFARWRQVVASTRQLGDEVARLGAARGRLERQQEAAVTLVRCQHPHQHPRTILAVSFPRSFLSMIFVPLANELVCIDVNCGRRDGAESAIRLVKHCIHGGWPCCQSRPSSNERWSPWWAHKLSPP